jgi:hypothetical protein
MGRRQGATQVFRVALFICLTYNPFVQDYLVASRGYSPHFEHSDFPLPDRFVYVLWEPMGRPFIESQHLHVIYKGETSEAVVAIRATH